MPKLEFALRVRYAPEDGIEAKAERERLGQPFTVDIAYLAVETVHVGYSSNPLVITDEQLRENGDLWKHYTGETFHPVGVSGYPALVPGDVPAEQWFGCRDDAERARLVTAHLSGIRSARKAEEERQALVAPLEAEIERLQAEVSALGIERDGWKDSAREHSEQADAFARQVADALGAMRRGRIGEARRILRG